MACGVQPLVLEYGSAGSALSSEDPDRAQVGPCLLCREEFNLSGSNSQDLFKHLLESHKLVIADADRIANLQSYIEYWRPRLKKLPLESVCVKMEDMTAEGPVYYYMLSSVLKEDRLLRSKLNQERLKKILNLQQLEREDNSKSWCCLFCGELITGNRSLILGHMKSEHNFNIGHPDNLVHVEAFLNKLHDKLDRLLCLYCEKTFKDKLTLKEHMRKKLHKKLNPRNQEYDKFYLINYLEMGCDREPKTVRRGRGGVVAYITTSTDSDAEEEWQEETDENTAEQYQSTCLFCPQTAGRAFLSLPRVDEKI
ncbi:zinc finger protein 277-like isoform X2 [Watersipora subatra]|uniref:zinc finger protein 277-like isoform X2 n=1 Tax=Watersipora subatra TaxID=2589382 RepID=UPI00355B54FC